MRLSPNGTNVFVRLSANGTNVIVRLPAKGTDVIVRLSAKGTDVILGCPANEFVVLNFSLCHTRIMSGKEEQTPPSLCDTSPNFGEESY